MSNNSLRGGLLLAGLLLLSALRPALADNNPKYVTPPPPVKTPTERAQASADQQAQLNMQNQPTLLSWIQRNGDAATFYRALRAANLTSRYDGTVQYTVLVPTDEAFAALPAGVEEALFLPENKDLLVKVIDYNTLPGTYGAEGIWRQRSLRTFGGGTLDVYNTTRGRLEIGNASLVASDETASNGVVHIVDTVLLPADVVNTLEDQGYVLTAYLPGYTPPLAVMDSVQRNPDYRDGDYTAVDIDPATTPFGDSGTYGNYSRTDRSNFYAPELEGAPVIVDGALDAATVYSPSLRTERPAAVLDYSASRMDTLGGTCGPQAALEADMRKLWTDHVMWTRDYIIAAVDDKPDAQAASDRLMENQEDIGKVIATYYGDDAGNQLTALLKQHIAIAAKVIAAAKRHDTTQFNAQNKAWQDNGQAIAVFLSNANPNWPLATVSQMMQQHLSTTTAEVRARLANDYPADIAAYDEVYTHILSMADALADGIVQQFPQQVALLYPSASANGVVMGSFQTNPAYAQGDVYYSSNDNRDSDYNYNGGCGCCAR